jgi:hypothetical protein
MSTAPLPSLLLLSAAAALSLLACSEASTGAGGAGGSSSTGTTSSSTSTSTGSGGAAADAGTGDPTVLVGSFHVKVTPPAGTTAGSTTVLGKVYDGPTPAQLVWEKQAEEGACRLSTPRVPFCSTSCGGSAVCVEDETCQPYPTAHGAGAVTVTGIATTGGGSGFAMSPIANAYQVPAGTEIAYPGFAEGDAVTFAAAGDYWAPFQITAPGVHPLALGGAAITLASGTAIPLGWDPPAKAGISTIYVKLDISHHGGTKGMIECEAEDTGSLTIPASLLDSLLDLGVAGYPSIVVTRRATGSVTIASGRVDLVISSTVEQAVSVEGLTSCTSDADCPAGETCLSDLTCA